MTVDKSPDAFRTISEVAGDLDLPQHVLRFWETRFSQIRPLKRGGGRRYYRPDDVELLRGIRHLLYDEGYTIKGVQRILRERGAKFVINAAQGDLGDISVPESDLPEVVDGPPAKPAAEKKPSKKKPAPEDSAIAADAPEKPSDKPVPLNMEDFADEDVPRDVRIDDGEERGTSAAKMPFRFIDRLRGERPDDIEDGDQRLSREDVRRLQATLFELLEIKRLLDQAR